MKFEQRCITVLLVIAAAVVLPLGGQNADKPLPDETVFLQGVRRKLQSDDELQKSYTYTEKRIERHFGKDGKVKSTEVRIYEIYPGIDERRTYRRLVERDGKPLSRKELEKQDKKQYQIRLARSREREKETAGEKSKRLARDEERRRKRAAEIDELFQLYEYRMTGRQLLEGRPAIVFNFGPKLSYQPQTEFGKDLKKFRGTASFAEQDQELVRLEVELLENVSIGLVLARLNKGATAVFERRMVNDEVWLPARRQFSGSLRLFVFKGLRANVASEYSNYKKFSVETSIKFDSPKP